MTTTTTTATITDRPFQYLPIGLFGSVMGLTGLSSAWHLAEAHSGAPGWIHLAVGAVAVAAFLALLCAYAIKFAFAPDAVSAEFRHPIAGSLFGTFIISVLLLPIVIAPFALHFAQAMWAVGAVAMVLFAWLMVDRWMGGKQSPEQATPTWIVPVVGMLDVPLAMPGLDLPPELQFIRLVGLTIGLFFGLPIFTLILGRLMFQAPMPPALQPSLLILLAPFSVGVSTYIVTTGQVDLFAQALFALAVFILAVLVGRLRYVLRVCPFRVGWWAVSFPLASIALAGFHVADVVQNPAADALAWALLVFASVVIGVLAVRTLTGVIRGELKTLST